MDDQVLVGVMDGGADRQEQLEPPAKRKLVRTAVFIEGDPFDVLHHQIGVALLGGAAVEQAGDIRVFEPRQDLTFEQKALPWRGAGQAAGDHRKRGRLLEFRTGPPGEIDGAHASFPEKAFEAPDADLPTCRRRLELLGGDDGLRPAPAELLFVVQGQELIELNQKPPPVSELRLEEGGALRLGQLQRGVKQLFDEVPLRRVQLRPGTIRLHG